MKKKLSNNNFGWILILNIYQRKPQCVSNLLFLSLRQSQKSISLWIANVKRRTVTILVKFLHQLPRNDWKKILWQARFFPWALSEISKRNQKKKKKTKFMAPATSRRQFTFYHSVPRNSLYSFYRLREDGRLSRPWSHPVVLNTGPFDWESSALTTRPLLPVLLKQVTQFKQHSSKIKLFVLKHVKSK